MTKREIISFLLGAQTFHTLSHIFLRYTYTLPVYFFTIEWTQQRNILAILFNIAVLILLYWWFKSSKK